MLEQSSNWCVRELTYKIKVDGVKSVEVGGGGVVDGTDALFCCGHSV